MGQPSFGGDIQYAYCPGFMCAVEGILGLRKTYRNRVSNGE